MTNKFNLSVLGIMFLTLIIFVKFGSMLLGSTIYLWSVIFYLLTFAMFNKETEMGDISIVSLTLPFIPFVNVLIGALTLRNFLKKR